MTDFIMTPLMAAEMLVAEYMFAARLEKKPFFLLRFFGAAFVCLALTVWIEIVYSLVTGRGFEYGQYGGVADSVFKFFYYVVIFIMTIGCIRFSFRGDTKMILLFCSAGYAAQHIAKSLCTLLSLIPAFSLQEFSWRALFYASEALVFVATYFTLWFLFIREKDVPTGNEKNAKEKVILSFAVIFICTGISRISTDNPDRGVLSILAESLYAVVSCALILYILQSINEKDRIENENDFITELLHREREQYKISKENIELINIKCHDLKHQISALRQGASDEYITEIENAIMIYDSVVKTGNDELDIILTEKSLLCEKKHINLTCAVNGKDLAFMDKMDIYSIFGNALSNAIEGVSRIADEKKRCISINVKTVGNMLSVHIENFFEGEIRFFEGLPVSEKDGNYHGFGMKSMASIARKYDGAMNVSAQENKFCLDFILPVRKRKGEE